MDKLTKYTNTGLIQKTNEIVDEVNKKLDKPGTAANSLKVNGLTVETAVPKNAKFTDTIYTHPTNHPVSMITGLSTIATSGSYNDLKDKPTIPSVDAITNTYIDNLFQ